MTQQGFPVPAPGPPPPRSPWRSARLAGAIAGAVAAILAAVLVVVLLVGGDDESSNAGEGEVFLEPTTSAGPDPFSASVATPQPTATNPGQDPVGPPSSGGVRTANGDIPGLYGGTRNLTTCDPELMITFLAQNPDKARAWAGVVGINPVDIPAYIRDLTPVLLRTDTRVTNHGFANGRAFARQAVLEAGTAVLVDKFGTPRVRCYCGNPLLDPVATKVKPVYTGPRWPRFAPETIVVVQQTTVIIDTFSLYDPTTGALFGRPRGGTGANDVDDPRVTTRTTPTRPTTQAPTVTRPTTPARPSGPTDEELAREKLDQADAQCYPFPAPIQEHVSQEVNFPTVGNTPNSFIIQVVGYTADDEVQDFQWVVERGTIAFTPITDLATVASEHCPILN